MGKLTASDKCWLAKNQPTIYTEKHVSKALASIVIYYIFGPGGLTINTRPLNYVGWNTEIDSTSIPVELLVLD